MTTFSKNLGENGLLRDVVSSCVKRSMSDSVAVLPLGLPDGRYFIGLPVILLLI